MGRVCLDTKQELPWAREDGMPAPGVVRYCEEGVFFTV